MDSPARTGPRLSRRTPHHRRVRRRIRPLAQTPDLRPRRALRRRTPRWPPPPAHRRGFGGLGLLELSIPVGALDATLDAGDGATPRLRLDEQRATAQPNVRASKTPARCGHSRRKRRRSNICPGNAKGARGCWNRTVGATLWFAQTVRSSRFSRSPGRRGARNTRSSRSSRFRRTWSGG